MKTLNEYLSLPFKLEIIPDKEEGYVASYPELPGCISCGSTMEDAIRNAEDAKRAWLEAALLDIPNAETLAAIDDVYHERNLSKTFHSDEELMEDLNT